MKLYIILSLYIHKLDAVVKHISSNNIINCDNESIDLDGIAKEIIKLSIANNIL